MILLKEMNLEMFKLLNRISCSSQFPQVRNRAQCIILIYQGFSPEQLITIFRISRRTLYNWVTRWEKSGFVGLYNEKG
ncbi:helix-turn-helix domain-containing protein, partial [Planktothrix sp. PCC 11201]